MAELAPWDSMAKVFFKHLSQGHGRPTVDLRIILGALMVKHIENLSDEDTIEYIQENIYAQYFVGLSSFQIEPVFVPSLFVEIRKRLGKAGSKQLNDILIKQARSLKVIKHRRKPGDGSNSSKGSASKENQEEQIETGKMAEEQNKPNNSKTECSDPEADNRGTLMLDATVSPLHIAFPTDSALLNHARKHTEELIDRLYESERDLWPVKPRTYRREARKAYVSFSKKRNKRKKDIRKAVGRQLRYVRRNIKTLHRMLDRLEADRRGVCWSHHERRLFWIVQELYRQQNSMYRDGRRRIDDRVVSIEQPHARPIKRGKSGAKDTEFGPKINVSMTEGIARVDQANFNAFNESTYLRDQIEGYKALYGYYPALVLADKIYMTQKNRKYMKTNGIEHSGVPLGRKARQSKHEKQRLRKRNNKRSEMEGKFGQAKLKYGLDELFTRLPDTIMAQINLIFLSINLLKMAKEVFGAFFAALLAAMKSFLQRGNPIIINHRRILWSINGLVVPQRLKPVIGSPTF